MPTADGSIQAIPTIHATTRWSPPPWAILQREVFDALDRAAPAFVARYARPDGTLIWREQWPGMDGSDGPYEGFLPRGRGSRAFALYRWIVRLLRRMLSFSSSPRMRSAPHRPFSVAICSIGAIVCAGRGMWQPVAAPAAARRAGTPRDASAARWRAARAGGRWPG